MKKILTLVMLFAILATCPACETESKMEAQTKPTIEFASDLDSETLGEYVVALTDNAQNENEIVAALLCAVIAQENRIHELELALGDCTQSWSEWAEDAREDNLRLQRLEDAMGIENEIEMPY